MAIIFDPPQLYNARYGRTCHLMSDQPGPKGSDELLAFARRIGMPARWIQKAGGPDEHFDLFEARLFKAVQAGATKVTRFRIHEVLVAKRLAMAAHAEVEDHG